MRLDISGDKFFPDLLFYNFTLRRFVVIELKTGKSKSGIPWTPRHVHERLDYLLAHPEDEPAIGLPLRKSKNEIVAEYSLRHFQSPFGVAKCATELGQSMPAEITRGLQMTQELEIELAVEFQNASETDS